MEDKRLLKVLRLIGDNPYIGVTVIDENGIVLLRNKGMEDISGISSPNSIGKKFNEVSPDHSLMEVLHTGKAQLGILYSTPNGNKAVVHRIPLKEQDHVFGAMSISVFYDITQLKDVLNKYQLVKEEMMLLKSELRILRGSKYRFSNIIGRSQNILETKRLARRYAAKPFSVLKGKCGE